MTGTGAATRPGTPLGRLVAAELIKARGTRAVWLLAAGAVLFAVAWAVVNVLVLLPMAGSGDPGRQVRDSYSMAQQGYPFALLLGIVVTAGEYRHRTITWAFLVTPRRGPVLTARLAACAVLGLIAGGAAAVAASAVTAPLLHLAGRPMTAPGLPWVLFGSVLGTGLWAALGAALGALVRSQAAATAIAFLWFFYAEWFLVMLLPSVGRWVPTGVAKAVSGWSRDGMVGFDGRPIPGALLPPVAAGLVFAGYVLAAALAARLTVLRRDVT
ncbi:hypothetical protein Sru01_00750 [Sphaerisporangium rufum]|uniref:ABC transporter permease n=1 Tax=Sphaerisporangium rufum TaxID=1381558 RepID=A0A919QWB9_9ACTN|nr:hypothetical protein [Sphaerisporangium rufum]GII75093.1 hypothetical protein Sru01_00750 [Sphaerisporangium rufum]